MKKRLFSILIVSAILCGQVSVVSAQGSIGNWSSVQALATDTNLIVKQKDGRTIKGKMIEAADQSLTVDQRGKPITIDRTSIYQVLVSKGKAKKTKWTLIGTGIGAAVGAGIGASKVSSARDDSEIWLPVGLIFGAGAGAVGGLIFGSLRRDRELVYQAN